MKKKYETPTAEKIRFDYREQVVATSGGSGGTGEVRSVFSDGCDVQNMVVHGYGLCDRL